MRNTRRRQASAVDSLGTQTVDLFMERYVRWRERAIDVNTAYERWALAASAGGRATAFEAFSRALEREARAARRFHDCAGYASQVLAAQSTQIH